MTSSCQVPAVNSPGPWLVTVQPIVTCAGSPIVSDGAVTADATRSGYEARVAVSVIEAALFDSAVPAELDSNTWLGASVVTENAIGPTPRGPSGSVKIYCRAAEAPAARVPLRVAS